MGKDDGGILRWSDHGVRDDDGNHDDIDRSRVLADGFECGQRRAKQRRAQPGSFEANDIVANSRKQKNPLEAWRRLHDRQNRSEMSSEKESERLQKESWREKPGGKYARTESLRESESGR